MSSELRISNLLLKNRIYYFHVSFFLYFTYYLKTMVELFLFFSINIVILSSHKQLREVL